jgi:glycosyltransferase involved in cell wall biosynthesis
MQSLIHDDLTVIIPLYNKSETIERAVCSVLHQEAVPKEIIIVDDGSEDESTAKVKQLQIHNPIIKLVKQENRGVSAARNRGVMEAQTEFISFLDADDEWLARHTKNLQNVISKNQKADFFCVPYIIDSPDGGLKPHVALQDGFNGIIADFVRTYSDGYGLIHSSSVCFRRSFFLETGGFPEGVKSGEDIYLWLKAGLLGSAAAINKRTVILHKDEIGSMERRKKHVAYHVAYFTEHLHDYNTDQADAIRHFLSKNILLQWAAAKIEHNRWQRNILRSYVYKLNKVQWLLLLFSELIPARLFSIIRQRRIRSRLKNE